MGLRLEDVVRSHWWHAVGSVARATGGDLQTAEDSVQEACVAAVKQWGADGTPDNPLAWIVNVAKRRALDNLRREAKRSDKEHSAALQALVATGDTNQVRDDDLALIFMCCHPALDPAIQVALTLRSVCGLSVKEIAAGFLVPELTMAKRLVRGRSKIRQSGIRFKVPLGEQFNNRLPYVFKVIQLVFNAGYVASAGDDLVRPDLCLASMGLARALAELLPGQPEPLGLLAMLLLTDARRPARTDAVGDLVLLEDQDRSLWNKAQIDEGVRVLDDALALQAPGPYQLQAAIAACHSTAANAEATDWRQIALLYGEWLRYEASPVIEANRAVAVAMAEGPVAGLVILEALRKDPQMESWYPLHIARGDLLKRAGRFPEATDAYRLALELEPNPAERRFVLKRVSQLEMANAPGEPDN